MNDQQNETFYRQHLAERLAAKIAKAQAHVDDLAAQLAEVEAGAA